MKQRETAYERQPTEIRRVLCSQEKATYNRSIKKGIFKVSVASQKLLAEESGILHILEQPNAELVLRQVRESNGLESRHFDEIKRCVCYMIVQ